MASTGLLLISNAKHITQTLKAIEKYVNILYIHLNIPPTKHSAAVSTWSHLISQLYIESAITTHHKLDVNILIGPLKQSKRFDCLKQKAIDVLFSDGHYPEMCEQLRRQLHIKNPTVYLADQTINNLSDYQKLEPTHRLQIYDNVVLGGTFDRIHWGHKVFLTEAVLRACRRLVVGITTNEMTKSKILSELILPVEQRIADLKDFLQVIDATLEYELVPINDPFGPTRTDPTLNMIVVSAETKRGGEKVNEERLKNNLKPLEIYCIDLIKNCEKCDPKESKISSSNSRIDLLGTRLRQPEPRPNIPMKPYLIGLTGGIGSGKSKMSKYFQSMGAIVMDCDKIAHDIYEPNKICYQKLIDYFGQCIIDKCGFIDRRILGTIVFNNSAKLDVLNSIVWPELLREVKKHIQMLPIETESTQPQIVILEAAVLHKANWDTEVHEIWSMIIPHNEAIKRVMKRDGLSMEAVQSRLKNQLTNKEIVERSHIVFSSQWNPEFTMKQAQKAWKMLINELEEKST